MTRDDSRYDFCLFCIDCHFCRALYPAYCMLSSRTSRSTSPNCHVLCSHPNSTIVSYTSRRPTRCIDIPPFLFIVPLYGVLIAHWLSLARWGRTVAPSAKVAIVNRDRCNMDVYRQSWEFSKTPNVSMV